MKIFSIQMKNFGPHQSFSLAIDDSEPLVIVYGGNEVGKSMIAEAIDYALRGKLSRIGSNAKGIVSTGEKAGMAQLGLAGDSDAQFITRALDGGKPILSDESFASLAGNNAIWPLVSSVSAFSAMSLDERRKTLFGAFGVSDSVAGAAEVLRQQGISEGMIKAVSAMPSFEAALKHAEGKASEARGAWKAITGETYGDVKGAKWMPPPVAAVGDVEKDKAQLAANQEKITTLKAEAMRRKDAIAQLRDLDQKFTKVWHTHGDLLTKAKLEDIAEIQDYLTNTLEPAIKKLEPEVAQLDEKVRLENATWIKLNNGVRTAPETMTCPCCQNELLVKNKALVKYTPEPETVSADELSAAQTALAETQKAHGDAFKRLHSFRNSHANMLALYNAYAANNTARQAFEEVHGEVPALDKPEPEDKVLADLNNHNNELNARISAHAVNTKNAQDAASKEKNARQEHELVQAWSLLAQWLKPSGCQSLMLHEVLSQINQRLAENAKLLGWSTAVINEDMSITYNGLPCVSPFASKSGKWRADVMVTEAILHLSGCRSMVIDEVDILAVKSRPALLKWVHGLHKTGQMSRFILLGTFKEAPTVPKPYRVVCLESQS